MPDPIHVENAFQDLKIQLESTESIRQRYHLIRGFLEGLKGEYKRYQAYILQIADEVPLYEDPVTWSGLNPNDLESDIELYQEISRELQSNPFAGIINHLKEICLLLYACLDEEKKVADFVKELFDIPLNGLNSKGSYSHPQLAQLKQYLEQLLHRSVDFSNDQRKVLNRLWNQISQISKEDDAGVLIPVVELNDIGYSSPAEYGRLRQLSVELYGNSEHEDKLVQNFRLYGAEKSVYNEKRDALIAARNLFEGHKSVKKRNYFKGGINFELSGAIHNGNSANLAIAALWYTQLLQATGQRERYSINPHIAITGDVDSDGTVQPVEKETIGLKARGAFFSWAKVLVVPAVQVHDFERELQRLLEIFPNRKLYLMGVYELKDLFYDRRVADHITERAIVYYLNRIREKQTKLVLYPTIVVLMVIIARFIYGPIDNNPQNFFYEGSSLVIENQYGAELARIEVGAQTAARYDHPAAIAGYPLTILTDINGDGVNEVIYGKRNRLNQSNREISDVTAYSVTGDSTIWSRELMLHYDFPRQSGVLQQEMLIREMGHVDTENGPKIVVNANSYYYFQTVLYLFDSVTGDLEAEYLHIGHIRDIMLQDVNQDGQEEVLFTGINNAYWLASAGILSIDDFHGYSPLTRDYRPAGIEPANELSYILIPKTVIAEYTNPAMKYNEGKSIYYDIANQSIRVLVEEGRTVFRKQEGEVIVTLGFDNTMKPVGVGTSDIYDIVARQLFEEGEIREIPDFDYFESYKDSILYWTGEEFVTTLTYFKQE